MGQTIKPHGGVLINRLIVGEDRRRALKEAEKLIPIKVDAWTISDIDLIGIGAFSPLTGFMQERDYHNVVKHMRLLDGTVWSIPITLPVEARYAEILKTGNRVSLVGEEDGIIYAVLEVGSIYQADHQLEAINVFKTDDEAHPGVQKMYSRSTTYIGGSIEVLNRPERKNLNSFISIRVKRGVYLRRRAGNRL
jgi:sulfate adenylyltransferase